MEKYGKHQSKNEGTFFSQSERRKQSLPTRDSLWKILGFILPYQSCLLPFRVFTSAFYDKQVEMGIMLYKIIF